MKHTSLCLLTAVTLLTGSLPAGDLQPESISADAKWLVHLNLDAFRETALGAVIFDSVIKPNAGDNPMGFRIKTEDIYEGVHAMTAYGNSYPTNQTPVGVLIFRTNDRLRAIFEAALIQQEAAGADEGTIATVQTDPFPVYSMKGEMYAGILPGDVVVVSKSLDQMMHAVDVIDDRAPGLDQREKPFAGTGAGSNSFFFLATAESFNEASMIPPQARVLQLAQTARIAMGEDHENLLLNLTLQAENDKTRNQLQKIIEGLLALVSLGQMDNQDFADIVLGTQVETAGKDVVVAMRYPTEKVLQMLQAFGPKSQRDKDPEVEIDIEVEAEPGDN